MAKKLRVGVFGGSRGRVMFNVLLKHPDASVVAICDSYTPLLDKAKAIADECGESLAVFDNFDDFIQYDMDAVILANYANEHAPFAIRALRAGKHVMSEVLPCETMAQAVELIETVEETGLVYAYAENFCYMQHTFEMWQRYRTGKFGEIEYAEGEYLHNCAHSWHKLTRGDRNHWRNRQHPNFYCTHSIGPFLTITGLRPVKVTGFELPPSAEQLELGLWRGTGIEMVTLENGAMIKSLHGWLLREPANSTFALYCTNGAMESGRFKKIVPRLNVYLKDAPGTPEERWERYDPTNPFETEHAKSFVDHSGGDYYPTHFFIQKILGRPEGEWSIDVYRGVEMGICGILGYRSVLAGSIPVEIPNLRIKEERDKFRNDNACTNPAVAGDQLLPRSSYPEPEIPDEVYDRLKEKWENSLKG